MSFFEPWKYIKSEMCKGYHSPVVEYIVYFSIVAGCYSDCIQTYPTNTVTRHHMTITVNCLTFILLTFCIVGVIINTLPHIEVLPSIYPVLNTPTPTPHYSNNLLSVNNETLLFHRDVRNSFKMLNKQMDVMKSLMGSLRDQLATLKPVSSGQTQPECEFGPVVQGTWHENSGVWEWSNNDHNCRLQLPAEHRTACIFKHSQIMFLGDSQMYMLFDTVLRSLSLSNCTNVKSNGRCGILGDYMGIQELSHEQWRPPNFTQLEGPVANGLANPGCTDCSGCDAKQYKCEHTSGSSVILEYLPMEFTRDVELQSVVAGSTQENMLHYMSRNNNLHSTLVVLNAGVHDLVVVNRLVGGQAEFDSVEALAEAEFASTMHSLQNTYKQNIMWLASLLARHNVTKALFVATAPVRQPHPHTNTLVKVFNQHAFEVMALLGYMFLDTYSLLSSQQAQQLYSDDVHAYAAGGIYYETVLDLVLRVFLC